MGFVYHKVTGKIFVLVISLTNDVIVLMKSAFQLDKIIITYCQ